MKLIVLLIALLFQANDIYAKELIVVGADWCAYCIKQKQYIENNPQIIDGFAYEYINIEEHPELIEKLKLKVYPTSFIFDDEHKKVGQLSGFTITKFNKWIKKYGGSK